MKKRISAILLSVVLCLGMLSMTAFAAGGITASGAKGEKEITFKGGDGNTLCALWKDDALLLLFYPNDGDTVAVDTALVNTGDYKFAVEGGTLTNVTVNESETPPPDIQPVPVESVSLNKTALSLKVGNSETLTATVSPAGATDKTVTWTSSDASVATVDQSGKVTAVKAGTATVTAAAGGKTASCAVTVTASSGGGSSSGGGGGGGGGSSSGSNVTVNSASNGKITVSPGSPEKGDTVTITVTPNSGYALDKLTVKDSKGNAVSLKDQGGGKYTFTMPDGEVTVDAAFVKTAPPAKVSFTDVQPGAYYYDAVAWAVEQGVTAGTTAATFSPNNPCTRAQILTFLWRAAGSPAVGGANPFADVASGAYYCDAVAWAVANGITAGTSATTFSPNATCTRAQAVTFLYRAAGSPAAGGGNPFGDVASGAYYANAVQWAVGKGVTAGTSATTFSPNDNCTRAQIVTFLYRDRVN